MRVARPAQLPDLDGWLDVVREVEPLFGPMPDFAAHAGRAIARGTALVVADGQAVHGACLLSGDDDPRAIRWLAVGGAHRREGVGSLLIRAILARWPTGDIAVVTFASHLEGGAPARHFYESHGFERRGSTGPAPDGGARDLYVLPASRR